MTELIPLPPVGPRVFTLCLDYFATGEGSRQELMVCVALGEAEAREIFLKQFYPGEPETQRYFDRGLDVYPGVYRPILSPWLTEALIESLDELAMYSDPFYVHRYFNLS